MKYPRLSRKQKSALQNPIGNGNAIFNNFKRISLFVKAGGSCIELITLFSVKLNCNHPCQMENANGGANVVTEKTDSIFSSSKQIFFSFSMIANPISLGGISITHRREEVGQILPALIAQPFEKICSWYLAYVSNFVLSLFQKMQKHLCK